jgi:hypothetical protein
MAMTLQYALDLDHRLWLPVPLGYPWNGHDSAEQWADAVTDGMLAEVDASISAARPELDAAQRRALLRATALATTLAEPPVPEASERFWLLPREGREAVVHLYVSDYEGGTTADDLTAIAVAGLGGVVHSVEPVAGTEFETAARALVLVEATDPPVVVTRLIGVAEQAVAVLELLHPDPSAVAEVLPAMEPLFASIRLRRDAA